MIPKQVPLASTREIYTEWYRMFRMIGVDVERSGVNPYALGITTLGVPTIIARAKYCVISLGDEFTGWVNDQRRETWCALYYDLRFRDPRYNRDIPF